MQAVAFMYVCTEIAIQRKILISVFEEELNRQTVHPSMDIDGIRCTDNAWTFRCTKEKKWDVTKV